MRLMRYQSGSSASRAQLQFVARWARIPTGAGGSSGPIGRGPGDPTTGWGWGREGLPPGRRRAKNRPVPSSWHLASARLAAAALGCALACSPSRPAAPAGPPAVLRVAPFGSPARAGEFSSLQEAVRAAPPGAIVELPEGRVDGPAGGPLVLDKAVTLRGRGAFRTVLRFAAREGPPVVVLRGPGARLEGLAVEGGRQGVAVEGGEHVLAGVALRKQWMAGVRLGAGALTLEDGEVIGTGHGVEGLGVEATGGRLTLRRVLFRYAGRRALELTRTVALLEDLDIAGNRVSGVQVLDDAEVRMVRGRVSGNRGAGLFAAAARVRVEEVWFERNEFGVLAARGARVDLSGGELHDHRVAAYALVNATGSVRRAAIRRGGSEGGISVLQSTAPVVLEDNRLIEPGPHGVHLTRAQVILRHNHVEGARLDSTRGFGDAVYAQESELLLEGNTLSGNRGSGLALQQSTAQLVDNVLSGNGRTGLTAFNRSEARLKGNTVDGNEVGLLVAEGSRLQLASNRVWANGLAIDACGGRATEWLRSNEVGGGPGRRECK